MSDEETKKNALNQVEFYFADSNLPFDKFLFSQTRKDPQGWVPISMIASFKRMQPIRDAIGEAGIADALRNSASLLEVNEAGSHVRRTKELVQVPDVHARSIYAKGFPDEYESLQGELESFFAQFGKINGVRMRRETEVPRKFKNSVFVEFASAPEMATFLKSASAENPVEDGGHGIAFKDIKLQVMSKPAYVEMKMKEKGIDPNSRSGKGPRKFNAFRELERERNSGSHNAGASRTEPLEFEYNGKTLTTHPDGSIDAEQVVFPAQSVLRFSGAGKGGSWKDLKDTLTTLHPTSFVEFPGDAESGAVGFREPVSDSKLEEIKGKTITVGGQPVVWERVEEDNAKDFYVERAKFRANFLLDRREADRSAPRGGRGGRGRGRGRGGFRGRGGDKRKRDAPPQVGAAKRSRSD
ncbi:hypothetical protein MVES1_002163 [Malassezia vespertilionis]|uniref:Lhp1p n=1 Tax=Malassezia vespertilionis TaxID=2020962 RepID=A0A2N1JBT5_9BASI|nr:uncharacterized protein MVES1_002163 [Malassezia vespertilionis]PKI84009.1 hypothetical protein MVES_002040 [Malassezia vespertilionis]WFD06809.1 hypothetical protein MVES1_002163 [Malassezia vespertilionis]